MTTAKELLNTIEALMTYTVYKVELNGSLSHKEHLNNLDELNDWMEQVRHKFNNVLIVQDQTGTKKFMTKDGDDWVEQKGRR
jgi:hypothetical protein